jgi:hypothetical protein
MTAYTCDACGRDCRCDVCGAPCTATCDEAAPGYGHEYTLRNAVNASCTCGGRGPTDPEVCPACMTWHRARGAAT